MEVQHDITKMPYKQITNHLVTKVSKIEDISTGKIRDRNVLLAKTSQKGKNPKKGSIHMLDGSVYTGFYFDVNDIPQDQKNKVITAREKKRRRVRIHIKYQR